MGMSLVFSLSNWAADDDLNHENENGGEGDVDVFYDFFDLSITVNLSIKMIERLMKNTKVVI